MASPVFEFSLPGISETGYCQIQFTSMEVSSQGRCTNSAKPLELNKGGTTPAVDDCVHVGISIVVLTVGYDNVAAVTNIEADYITGSLSWYTLHLQDKRERDWIYEATEALS